ncbi:MAG: type I polyketide synthase, partial [Cyanobacteria bacterium J06639_14]
MIQSRASTPESGQNNYRDLLQNATMQIRSLRSELDDLRRQQTEPIAIIGMACRFPGGANTPEAYWELLRNGVDAISEIPSQRWDVAAHYDPDADVPGKMYTRHAGFIDRVDQFDPQFFGISPREAHSLDPQQRLLLEVGYTALENAGQPPFDLRGTRTGVFVGVSFDDYAQLSVRSGDLTRIDAYSSLGNTRSIAAGRLSYTFGFQGPTMQLDTTCSSSLLAIHLACQSLRSGESNLALAGGVNLMLSPEPTIGFCKLKALAPDGRCKTFDAAADGYGRGEGCGIVVLKRLSDAIANQDPILAVLRGSAVNHDGLSNGLTAPNGAAQEAVLRQALDNANVEPEQVQYVEVHGTGTRLGDPIEVLALDKIMGQRSNPLLVGSVKTNIGHLESAAGVASLIKVILALQHQQIPPHLHLQTPNPYIPWDKLAVEVPTQLTPWTAHEDPRLAGISSFGMSGTNVHLILEEAPLPTDSLNSFLSWQDRENIRDRPLHLLPLSARSEDALRELVKRYQDWLDGCEDVVLPDVCFAAGVGRSHFNHRVAFLAADLPQLCQQLSSFLSETPTPGILAPPSTTPRRKIAFLFTGQGSQYPGMGRHLYEHEPAFRRAIDDCAEILAGEGINLLELMYGEVRSQESGARSQESGVREQELGARSQEPGANNEERRTKNEQLITNNEQPIQNSRYPSGSRSGVYKTQNSSSEFRGALLFPQGTPNSELRIHQTQFAQPTLFALEYALAQLWLSWGIEPDGVMGHSIGEYVAACVAGVFSLEDGLRLVAARGRLMQALPAGGGMVAVMASVEQVAKLLPKGISVAAINGPEATVISGDLTVLADVVAVLERDGIKHKALPVSHAFHSELMEPLLAAFKTVTDVVAYAPPQIELIANITGQVVECVDADYWVRHVRQPVQFAAGMNTLATEGYDTFIEIGPKPTLLAMGRTSVSQSGIEVEPEALWLPSVRPDADWLTLLTSLGQLYASGATIDWAGFDQSYPRQMVQLPNYPFQNQRYWVDIDTQEKARYVAPSQPHPLIHPLLGSPLPLAGDQVRYFEVQLRQDLPGYLQDHQVFGEVLFPAAGYLEIAIAAARSCLPDQSNPLVLCDVSLPKGLLLPSEETVVVQTVVTRSRSEDLGSE